MIISPNVHQFSGWKFKKPKTFNTHDIQPNKKSFTWHLGLHTIIIKQLQVSLQDFCICTLLQARTIYDWSSEQITIESKDIRDFRNSMHLFSKHKLLLLFMDKQNPALMKLTSWKKNGWSFLYPSWIDSKSISSSFSSSAEVSNSVNIQIGVFLSWFDGLQIAKSLEDSVVV